MRVDRAQVVARVIVRDDLLGALEGSVAFVVGVGSMSVRVHQRVVGVRRTGLRGLGRSPRVDG
ncbi:hypothetical protein Acsp05_12010 [Actinokineospora sp. NBRC 105648]|nr:hypothetical protein Acsp05_12010 [Actinokineospora sp. NBRC 105648]